MVYDGLFFRFYNVDISVAVSTDSGLITPIVFDADKKVYSYIVLILTLFLYFVLTTIYHCCNISFAVIVVFSSIVIVYNDVDSCFINMEKVDINAFLSELLARLTVSMQLKLFFTVFFFLHIERVSHNLRVFFSLQITY